jgi:hypothetical protein
MPARAGSVDEHRRERLHPPIHRHVIDIDAALSQQLLDVAVGQAVAQIPAHRHRDHFARKPISSRSRRRDGHRLDHCLSVPPRHLAPSTQQCPPDNYSRINQGRQELIDHILVSHQLVGRLTTAATVPLQLPSIGVRPQTTPRRNPPSDHRPVLAHFDL